MSALSRVAEAVGHRRIRPPAPPGRKEGVPDKDPSTAMVVCEADESASTTAFITYTKASGEESARTITFHRIKGHFGKPENIGAYCHVRDRYRDFRIDRIGSMVCTVTGEELDPVEHCIALHNSGALKIEDVVLTRMIRVVAFMARCDGEFHRLEQSELADTIGRYMRFFGGDDAAYECAIKEAPRVAPSGEDFLKSLRYLTRAPDAKALCGFALDACAGMIDADGRIADDEVNWGIEVSNLLKAKAGR